MPEQTVERLVDRRPWLLALLGLVLAFGFLIILVYLIIALKHGPVAGPNPWFSRGFEWITASPPPTDNFGPRNPVYQYGPHEYDKEASPVPTGPSPEAPHAH